MLIEVIKKMDVTIKDVPKGAEEQVKEMSMVAIERFLWEKDVQPAEEIKSKFESDIDAIRDKNGLKGKFEKTSEVQQ